MGLSNPGGPDILAFGVSGLDVNFNAGSGTFNATGLTVDYINGSVSLQGAGAYSLTASITPAGFLTSGSLTINGDVGSGDQILLSGSLSSGWSGPSGVWGFQDPSEGAPRNIFEFLFTVTGGDNANVLQDVGGIGAGGGVIINADFGDGSQQFTGDWLTSFQNADGGNGGVSDNFAVPEPSSVSLLLLAGGPLGVVARRSRLKITPRRIA